MKNFVLSLTTNRDFDNKKNKLLSDNPGKKFYVNITEKPKRRSVPANNVYYAWIPAISDHTGDTIKETRNILKLDFGLPIVIADKDIGQIYLEKLNRFGFFNGTRQQQLSDISMLNVTSLLSTKQHNQLRDNILHHYVTMGVAIDYEK
ncbi:MAG TPA: hypothetical protein EYN67_18285 [Flavobacteriales bacterium]|nr:hypothetical protein [Flavobacteriales bacterium]